MNRDETKKIIMYLRNAYPGFMENSNLSDATNVWHDAFMNVDIHIIKEAVKSYTKTNEYPPTIAGIMKQINLINVQETEDDLWEKVRVAICNGTYGACEEFEKLPPECKSFIGSPQALKDLAQTDPATLNTVVKGQFHKRIGMIKEHQSVQNGLPMEVKAAIAESKRNLLEERYE